MKRKDSLETWAALLMFSFELETSGLVIQRYIKIAKNGGFYVELVSENDF